MATYSPLCVLFVLGVVYPNTGFILDDKADCQMTLWTHWSEPVSYGAAWRVRRINQYPAGGGSPCPADLVEVRQSEIESIDDHFEPLPLPITATLMIDNFLRPLSQRSYKRSANPGAIYRDLLIIVDSSGTIGSSNFNTSLNELIVLLMTTCPYQHTFDSMYNRAALIDFSSAVRVIFDFDDYQTSQQVIEAIRNAPYFGRSTNTGGAFRTALEIFKTSRGARMSDPNVKQEVLIITDGKSDDGLDAMAAVQQLQGVADVYALTIGRPSFQEMYTYVSKPQASHLFAMKNYQDLSKLVHLVLDQLRTHPTIHCMPFNVNG